MGVESCRASPAPPVGRPVYGTPYLGHGLRRPNSVPKFGASVKSSCPTAASSCCGAQNSLLACAHRILTAATPFCSLLPPLAALANVPLSTREPWEAEAPQAVHQVRTVILCEDSTKRNQNPSFYTTVPEATGEFFGRLGAGLIGVEDLRSLLRRLGGEAEAGGGEAHSLPVLPVGQP